MTNSRLRITLTIVMNVLLFMGSSSLMGQEPTGDTEQKTVASFAAGGPPAPPVTPDCAKSYYGKWYGLHYFEAQTCPDSGVYDMGWSQSECANFPSCDEQTGICSCFVETKLPVPDLTPEPDTVPVTATKTQWQPMIEFLESCEGHLQRIIDDAPNGDRKAAAQNLKPKVVALRTYLDDNTHSDPEKTAEVQKFATGNKPRIVKCLMVRLHLSGNEWQTAWDVNVSQTEPYLFDHANLSSEPAFNIDYAKPPVFSRRPESRIWGTDSVRGFAIKVEHHRAPGGVIYYRVKELRAASLPISATKRRYRIGQQVRVPDGEQDFVVGTLDEQNSGRFHQVIEVPVLSRPNGTEKFLVSSYDEWSEN